MKGLEALELTACALKLSHGCYITKLDNDFHGTLSTPACLKRLTPHYTALPWQKEVMTIFVCLSYGPKTKFCIYVLVIRCLGIFVKGI